MAAAIQNEGLIFACRRAPHKSLPGKWEFPGGKVEPGETHDAALRRELLEELNCAVSIGDLVAVSELGGITMHTYWASVVGEAPASSTDHDELRWVKIPELSTLDWAELDIPVVEAIIQAFA